MMKKIILIALMMILFATVANASVNGYIDGRPIVKVVSNGVELIPDGTPAMIYNNYTLVPVSTLRQLGFTVTWSQETYTVTVTPPEPIMIEVIVNEEGKPVEPIPDEGKPPLDAEGETTSPTTTASPSPTPVDNTAQCQAIRDDYAIQIWTAEQKGKWTEAHYLKYYRDQALLNAGCE